METTELMAESDVETSYALNSTKTYSQVEANYGHNSMDDRQRGGSQLWTQQYG